MAYDFTAASDQFLSVGSSPITAVPLSMACWFQLDTTSGIQWLISVGDDDSIWDGWALVFEDVSNVLSAQTVEANGVAAIAAGTTSLSTGTWYHGCAVFSANDSRTVYTNGGDAQSNALTRTPSGIDAIHIANKRSGATTVDVDGRIAEVGIWNVALTAADVLSLSKGVSPMMVRPESLQFYAPLVRDTVDRRGGRTLSNTNGAVVAAHPGIYYPHRRTMWGRAPAGGGGTAALTGSSHTGQQTSPSVVFNVPL